MPLPVITDVLRVTLDWLDTELGTRAANVMHFFGAPGNEDALFASLDSHVVKELWNCSAAGAGVDSVTITALDGVSASHTYTTGLPTKWDGARSGSRGIPQVAMIVKLTTPDRGRSKRGRIFVPFVAESAVSGNQLDTTLVAAAQSAWSTFRTAMQTDGYPLQVASYLNSATRIVTGTSVENLTGTQRRRNKR